MSKEENNKKETDESTPPIIEKDEDKEKTVKEITDKEATEKEAAEKELAEKEAKTKANKKKANKKRTKKKKKAPSLIGKKIVMKMTLGTPKLCFLAGSGFVVGKDLSVETAQAWLKSGAAELIGNLPSPSEFK